MSKSEQNKMDFIVSSSLYGLCFKNENSFDELVGIDISNENIITLFKGVECTRHVKEVIPIVRSFSDINKTCIQKGYNNGMSFIPIIEIAKTIYPYFYWFVDPIHGDCCVAKDVGLDVCFFFDTNTKQFTLYENGSFETISKETLNYSDLRDLLIELHFWIDKKESDEVFYVTNDFNPYK